MLREDRRGYMTVDLGPELYGQICQIAAVYGVQKSELMRASVKLMLSAVTLVAKTGMLRQRDALRTILEAIPSISEGELDVIPDEPWMDALLEAIAQNMRGSQMTIDSFVPEEGGREATREEGLR